MVSSHPDSVNSSVELFNASDLPKGKAGLLTSPSAADLNARHGTLTPAITAIRIGERGIGLFGKPIAIRIMAISTVDCGVEDRMSRGRHGSRVPTAPVFIDPLIRRS